MLKLPNVTLVCVDCVNHRQAQKALIYSMREIEFAEVLFQSGKFS